MKTALIIAVVFGVSYSQANKFDFVFVHKAECYNFSEDSIDYCRIEKNQKEIKPLNDVNWKRLRFLIQFRK